MDPFKCCPICGIPWKSHSEGCPKSVLRAIDAADTRSSRGPACPIHDPSRDLSLPAALADGEAYGDDEKMAG